MAIISMCTVYHHVRYVFYAHTQTVTKRQNIRALLDACTHVFPNHKTKFNSLLSRTYIVYKHIQPISTHMMPPPGTEAAIGVCVCTRSIHYTIWWWHTHQRGFLCELSYGEKGRDIVCVAVLVGGRVCVCVCGYVSVMMSVVDFPSSALQTRIIRSKHRIFAYTYTARDTLTIPARNIVPNEKDIEGTTIQTIIKKTQPSCAACAFAHTYTKERAHNSVGQNTQFREFLPRCSRRLVF